MRRLLRSKGDHAVLEGPRLVGEAVALRMRLEQVLATPEFLASEAGRRLSPAFPSQALEVAPAVIDSLTDADSPRGVLAVVSLPRSGIKNLPLVSDGIYVLADRLQDPGNLGALARVTEAAGGAGLALTAGCAHPNHPRALRASAGSLLRLPVAIGVTLSELSSYLSSLRPRVVALAPRGGHDLYGSSDSPMDGLNAGALVLLLGGEGSGLAPELAAQADLQLTIPTARAVESLNATTAAAVMLFEIRRRRGGLGLPFRA